MLYAICKTLDAGTDYDEKIMKKNNIKVGDEIEVDSIFVHSWSTDVYLVGYEDNFNSVFFNFVDEDGNEVDIYSDERFRDYY